MEKMGMIEDLNKNPKLQGLLQNVISIGIIFSLVYGALTFVMHFTSGRSLISWFQTSEFMTVIILFIFLFILSKILKGGEIRVPEQFQNKDGKKMDFNFPDTWGIKNQQSMIQQPQQPQQQPQQQSPQYQPVPVYQQQPQQPIQWQCPNCGNYVNGLYQCNQCGYIIRQ